MKNIINREQPFQVLATNFSIGPSSSGYELEISADGVNYTSLFTVGANVTRMVTGVANGSYYRLAGNTDEDVVVNWRTQCNDGESGGGGGTGPQGPQGPQGAEGAQGPAGADGQNGTNGQDGAQGPQGEVGPQGADGQTGPQGYQGEVGPQGATGAQGPQGPAGEGGSGSESPIIAIDNLNGPGSANTIYDYNGRLYHWVSGAGVWGKWVIADYDNTNYSNFNNQMNYLNYSYIPSSTTFLCNIKLVSPKYSLSYDSANSTLLVYDNEGGTGNVVATVYKNGQEVNVFHPSYTSRHVKIRWIEGLITINCDAFVILQNNISTTESTGHYEAIDIDFFKGENKNGSSANRFYLPAWNSEGLVYGNAMNVSVAQRKINTTTYGNSMYFLAESSHAGTSWQTWYFPTQGGIQGQVLTSNGDAEPVWASVDTEMSSGSTNMVQNKVIKSYVDGLVGDINTILQSI